MAISDAEQLALAVVQVEDAPGLERRLAGERFPAIRIDAAGGFLRRESALVVTPIAAGQLPGYLEAVRSTCRARLVAWIPPLTDGLVALPTEPIDVEVGGAVVFVLPVERVVELQGRPAGAGQLAGVGA